jgi:uncharacterized protein involved in exopolysaccharide biosynthesis
MAEPKGSDSLRSVSSDSLRPKGTQSVRWLLWLFAGMLFGVLVGFVFGLARPRARK